MVRSEKTCFVICPIGADGSAIRKHSDLTFDYIIKPIVTGLGYFAERADKIRQSGIITNQIIEKIITADLVIADLTDNNPNVYYELAIRHATEKPCIPMLSPPGAQLPFDVHSMRTIFFDVDVEWGQKAQDQLRETIVDIETNGWKSANPLLESIARVNLLNTIEEHKATSSGTPNDKILAALYELKLDVDGIRSDVDLLSRSREPIRSGDRVSDPYLMRATEPLSNILVEKNELMAEIARLTEFLRGSGAREPTDPVHQRKSKS